MSKTEVEDKPAVGRLTRKGSAKPVSERTIISEIADHHLHAIQHACDSVRSAAKAGHKLIEARETVEMPSFRKWVDDNLAFGYRTAYRYIKVAEMEKAGLLDFDGIGSINEALRIGEKSEKNDDDKKKKDERQETFVSHALKIEAWFIQETSKSPVDSWPRERKQSCRNLLNGVKEIYDQLDS